MSDFRATVESGRHPVNVGHLVMGVAFVGLAVVWSLIANHVLEGREVRWLLPIPWVLAGAAGLVAAAATTRRRHEIRQTGWVDPGAER
jgi:cytochrome bd-type quinol oxidase subunit 1